MAIIEIKRINSDNQGSAMGRLEGHSLAVPVADDCGLCRC